MLEDRLTNRGKITAVFVLGTVLVLLGIGQLFDYDLLSIPPLIYATLGGFLLLWGILELFVNR